MRVFPMLGSHGERPEILAGLFRFVRKLLEVLVPFRLHAVVRDRIVVERQELHRHLPIEPRHVLAVTLNAQRIEMLLAAVREQVQITKMLVIDRLHLPGPFAQCGEIAAERFVAQEISGQRRMFHKAFHGSLRIVA